MRARFGILRLRDEERDCEDMQHQQDLDAEAPYGTWECGPDW